MSNKLLTEEEIRKKACFSCIKHQIKEGEWACPKYDELGESDMVDTCPDYYKTIETAMRVFAHCPKCKEYVSPGFRTDRCPHCNHVFIHYKKFKKQVEYEKEWFHQNAIGRIKREMKDAGISIEELK